MRRYMLLFSILVTSAFTQASPVKDMPTTNFFGGFVLAPTFVIPSTGKTLTIGNLVHAGLGFEAPIYYWFNGGVKFAILYRPTVDSSFIFEMSPFIKPQLPFDTVIGRFTLYSGFSAGTSTAIWDGDDLPLFIRSGPMGFGFNGSATAGIEYFPILPLGIYAEGGYRGNVLWMQQKMPPDVKLATVLMHAPIINFGIRIAL